MLKTDLGRQRKNKRHRQPTTLLDVAVFAIRKVSFFFDHKYYILKRLFCKDKHTNTPLRRLLAFLKRAGRDWVTLREVLSVSM